MRVKTAAKSGDGVSSAIRVSVIRAGLGASAGVKSKRVTPTRKPEERGLSREPGPVRGPILEFHLRAGHWEQGLWPRRRGVKPNFHTRRRKLLWKGKPRVL